MSSSSLLISALPAIRERIDGAERLKADIARIKLLADLATNARSVNGQAQDAGWWRPLILPAIVAGSDRDHELQRRNDEQPLATLSLNYPHALTASGGRTLPCCSAMP